MRHWSGAVIKALSILKSWSKVLRLKPSDMFSLEEASAICQFLTETGPLLVGENSWTLTRFPAGLEPLQGSHACPSRYHGGQSEPAKAAKVAEWGDRGLKHPPDPQFLNAVLKAKANTSRGSGSRTWSLIYKWRKEENLKIFIKKNTSTFERFITCFVSLLSHVPPHSVYLCPFGLGIWVPSMHSNTMRHVVWSGRHNLQRNCHPLPALPWCWKKPQNTIIFKEVLGVEKRHWNILYYVSVL